MRQTDIRRASSLNAPYPRGGGIIQGGPEKNAQTLMRYNFSTAGHRVTRFPAKCSETNW